MVRSPRDADCANKQQSLRSCERLHAKHQHPIDAASGVSLLAAVRPALPGHHRLEPKWRAFTSVRGSANANCYTYCSSDAHLDRHSDSTSFVKWFHCSWKLAPDNVRQKRHRKRKEAEEAAPPRSPPVTQARRVCLTPNISTNAAPVHPNAGQLRGEWIPKTVDEQRASFLQRLTPEAIRVGWNLFRRSIRDPARAELHIRRE